MNSSVLKHLLRLFLVLWVVGWSAEILAQVAEAKPVGSVTSATPLAQAPAASLRPPGLLKSEAEVLAIISTNKLWERYLPPEFRILYDRVSEEDRKEMLASYEPKDRKRFLEIETNNFQLVEWPPLTTAKYYEGKSVEENLVMSALAREMKEYGGYKEEMGRLIARLEVLATPESLRAWALAKIKASRKDGSNNEFMNNGVIHSNQVPAAIRYMLFDGSPGWTSIKTQAGEAYISIIWGSGRGLSGLAIGGTNFQYLDGHAYITNWASGISVWYK